MSNHDDYKESSRSRRVHAKSTHGTLVSLLDELPSLPVIASTTTNSSSTNDDIHVSESPRRRRHILQRRVTVLYDALLQVGFEEQEYVEEILIRTQAAGLTEALDWACRFVATRHLPPFLTDENAVVDDNNSMSMLLQDPHRLQVIPAKQNNNNKSERMNEPSMIVHSDSTTTRGAPDEEPPLLVMASPRTNRQPSTTMDDDDDDDKAAQKAWLLARYEYEEEDEYDSVEEQQEEVVLVDAAASTTPSLQRQLHEMEQEYEQLNAIVVDEAQQYVMSKHEVKSMKKRHKALQKQLERVRRKVKQQQQQQQDEQQQARNAQNEANEEEQGGMMDLFGCDNNNEEQVENGAFDLFSDSNEAATPKQNDAAVPEVAPPATRHVVPDFSIPKQWTGQTPKQVLQERCKKLKCGPPKFHKQRHLGGGVVLTIACKPNRRVSIIQEQDEGPFFQDWEETQNYLATRALYEMDSSLPIYRILPPAFRDLWTSWLDTAKQKQEEKQQEVDNAKQQHMQQLVDAILSRQSETKTKKGDLKMEETTEDSELEDKDANVVVPDTWDDSSEESDEKPTVKPNKVSEKGIRLQQFFQKRRETPQYKAMLESRQDLPMYSYRQDLLDTIRDNQVTVLCAETGAGKTTQCGQFLLEEALNDGFGNEISILCTQPRRVSAISVAERVSEEFGDKHVGDTIGYHIRLESKKSVRTKLLFCTTGVVLRRLQDDPNLVGVTHVLVDEVHERQWQIDFLLIALRRLIHTTRKDLKVVLMSATLDAELFTKFFPGAPLLKVPGRTYPVMNYYLEDLIDATDHVVEEGSRYALRNQRDNNRSGSVFVTTKGGEKQRENYSMDNDAHLSEVSEDYVGYKMATRRSMNRVNEQVVNYDLIEDVLTKLLVNPQTNDALKPPDSSVDISSGAVLVFLPGVGEIQTLRERLEGSRSFGNRKRFDVIPMHSTLSPKDQRRAFVKSKKGCQKIILATNIAETSVTIPDVVCVIDSGLVREVHQNKRTSTSTLVTTWCSRASIKQRSGRAGRVQAGICCRLFSSRTANERMKDQAIPELQRVPLEEVCLSILAGRLGNDCMDFLQQAPQPPSEKSVSLALDVLKDVGAIDSEKQLAPLGYHLAKLPMDVRLGKMLIFGTLFDCLDPILTVAASLSCKSPFPAYTRDSLQAQALHKTFQHGTSDFMTICNVWKAFQAAHKEGNSRKFCDAYYLSRSALMEIKDTREQYLSLLRQIGFVSNDSRVKDVPPQYNKNGMKESVFNAVICAGLYPNVAHVDATQSGAPFITHNKERVHIHKSSVNAAKGATVPTDWIVFYEKFATHRVYISDTAFVHPYSLLLFGGPLVVKHQDRKVLVGDWVEVPVAAQTGVLFRELRVKMDAMLRKMIDDPKENSDLASGIVNLIQSH